jgi:hypothetical protein
MQSKSSDRSKRFLKAACLAASLTIAAWSGGTGRVEATTAITTDQYVYGSISPSQKMSNVYVLYSLNSSGGTPDTTYINPIGDIAAGATKDFTFITGPPYFGDTYTVLGIYNSTGVTVGFNPEISKDIIGAKVWTDLFSSVTESTVYGYLANNELANIIAFYNDNVYYYNKIGNYLFGELKLVNFTAATDGGSAYAQSTPVPIPSTIMLLVPGIGLILLRRKINL